MKKKDNLISNRKFIVFKTKHDLDSVYSIDQNIYCNQQQTLNCIDEIM